MHAVSQQATNLPIVLWWHVGAAGSRLQLPHYRVEQAMIGLHLDPMRPRRKIQIRPDRHTINDFSLADDLIVHTQSQSVRVAIGLDGHHARRSRREATTGNVQHRFALPPSLQQIKRILALATVVAHQAFVIDARTITFIAPRRGMIEGQPDECPHRKGRCAIWRA